MCVLLERFTMSLKQNIPVLLRHPVLPARFSGATRSQNLGKVKRESLTSTGATK